MVGADKLSHDLALLDVGNASNSTSSAEDVFRYTIRPHNKARDITDDFRKAASTLKVGHLIKDEQFTLFESVQALEIMDSKMDSGFLQDGETLEEDYDVGRELSPQKVIGIIDQMLCYEVAWHQGNPLSQTLFTSLHLDHITSQRRPNGAVPSFPPRVLDEKTQYPHSMLHGVLLAYCIGMVKTVDIVAEMMVSQQYYEEEDFNTNTYNKNILTDVPDQTALELLDDACASVAELQDADPSSSVPSFPTSTTRQPPSRRWKLQKELLETIKKTQPTGKAVPECFSAKMHRKLASTVPPRPPVELPFDEALITLCHLFDDLQATSGVLQFGHDGSAACLRTFLWAFASRQPAPLAFPRAVLQASFLSGGGPGGPGVVESMLAVELRDTFVMNEDTLDESFWAVEVPKDPRYQVARKADVFVEQFGPLYANLYRSLCQNRCRIRRCLTNILADFRELLHKLLVNFAETNEELGMADGGSNAEGAPPELRRVAEIDLSIRCCVETQMLQLAQWVIQLGFEHDLYQPYELGGMYWLLEWVCEEWLAAVRRFDEHERISALSVRKLDVSIVKCFSSALSMHYAILSRLNLIKRPESPYANPKLQYALRIKPFQTPTDPNIPSPHPTPTLLSNPTRSQHRSAPVSLNLPSYETFARASQYEDKSIRELLQPAEGRLSATREGFAQILRLSGASAGPNAALYGRAMGKAGSEAAWEADTKATMRACIGAGLALRRTQAGVRGAQGEQVVGIRVVLPPVGSGQGERAARKGAHAWWVVPEVVDA